MKRSPETWLFTSYSCIYDIGVRIRRPCLLVVYIRYWSTDQTTTSLSSVYIRYWSTDQTTTSLGGVYTVLEYEPDDHVSWWCIYGIGVRTRRPRLLVVYIRYWSTDQTTTSLGGVYTVLEYGPDDHVSWWCIYGIGVRTRRPRLLVVYIRYWSMNQPDPWPFANVKEFTKSTTTAANRACKSRARKRGWGQLGAGGPLYSMLTYRTLFCFGRNNRTVQK